MVKEESGQIVYWIERGLCSAPQAFSSLDTKNSCPSDGVGGIPSTPFLR